jgi:hypothetical protein
MLRSLVVAGLVALAAGVGAVSPINAQESDPPVRRFSISLAAAEGAEVGVWARLHPRATLGLNVGATHERVTDDQGSDRFRLVSVEPAVKLALGADGTFLPYLYGSVFVESGRARAQATAGGVTATASRTQRRSGASVGAGADWFVVPRFSVGGHLGVLGGSISNVLRIDGVGQAPENQTGSFFSTFSSGLRVHLYF